MTEVTTWNKVKEQVVDPRMQRAEYHLRCRLQRSEFSFSALYSTGDVHSRTKRSVKKTVLSFYCCELIKQSYYVSETYHSYNRYVILK